MRLRWPLAGIAAFWRSSLGDELADLEQVEAERFDLSQDAVEPGLIQHAGQDGLWTLLLPCHRRKRGQQRGAEMAVDPDHVRGGCRAHAPIVQRDQVSRHRRDLVTRLGGDGLARAGIRVQNSDVVFRADHRKPGPAAPRLIQRGELLASLDRAAQAKVTLISAPAGSGKSSLLRAWADGPGQPYRLAVVQVQRDQQDSQQFWLAVLGAIRKANGTPGDGEQLAATPGFSPGAIADRVLAELAEHRDRTFLVIDDLHELTSPEALAQLTRLLEKLPPHVHAILATRRSLPLRLHKLRLAGDLAEIRTADLRFTQRETREFLEASGIALSEAGAAQLHQRTEGWAAGLRLAAISLAGRPDPERFVAEFSGSNRTVAEYLLAEMLEYQPAEVQQLLLRTSLLDRVNGELADLLTGHPGSERILLDLEDANAFVVSLDPARTWFRYHHLFADLLRLELRRRLPEQLPALHRLAAGWLTERGEIVDAIRHTQAAGNWSDAARLLADHSFGLTLDGQAQTIQTLLRAFPPGAVTEGPDIPLARATSELARGRLDEAAAHLTVAETSIAAVPADRRHRLEVATAALRLSLARKRGHLAGVVEQVRFLASPVTGQSDEDIALDSDLRAVALMNLGIVEAWSLGNQDSQRHLLQGADLARRIGRPYLEVACLAELAFAAKIEPFATTRRRCREAIALAEQHGWGAEPVISPALVNLAGVLIWTGEFDEGERWLPKPGSGSWARPGRRWQHWTTAWPARARSAMPGRPSASPRATRTPLSLRRTMSWTARRQPSVM